MILRVPRKAANIFQVSDYKYLKKDFDPWSYFLLRIKFFHILCSFLRDMRSKNYHVSFTKDIP